MEVELEEIVASFGPERYEDFARFCLRVLGSLRERMCDYPSFERLLDEVSAAWDLTPQEREALFPELRRRVWAEDKQLPLPTSDAFRCLLFAIDNSFERPEHPFDDMYWFLCFVVNAGVSTRVIQEAFLPLDSRAKFLSPDDFLRGQSE